jgi:hypothetical protein
MKRMFRMLVLTMALAGLVLSAGSARAQQILLDKPVRAGELTLFPDLANPNTYYYLPDKIALAKDANGNPQLSFLRYVENVRSSSDTREGEGGGIVHAVIELKVPDQMLNDARQALRRINSSGVIQGPIVYKGGTIALISSFKENNEFTKKVIGLGNAPLLDNEKVAISILLTKLGAKILAESFKTPTPDLSISFEMQMAGFRSPIGATIEANFDQIYEHHNFEAAVASPILAAEIKTTFDDLVKTGAIKVTQVGSDEKIEKAVEAAYTKLIAMMFDPVGGSGTPNLGQLTATTGNQPSMLDRATTMLNAARAETRTENDRRRAEINADFNRMEASAQGGGGGGARANQPAGGNDSTAISTHRTETIGTSSGASMDSIEARAARRRNAIDQSQAALPSLAVAMSYEMKRIHQQGIFRIDLNKYNSDNLVIRFDGNVGSIAGCAQCVREVNLDDPLYVQRELTAYVDGANATDFDKYINTVSVTMRKTHAKGAITTDELRVDRKSINAEGNNFKMLYGWKDDNDRSKWLQYEYKTDWFFFGGYEVSSDWTKSVTAAIPLSPPLVRRTVSIEADPDLLKDAKVRSIEVKVYSKIGTQEDVKETRLNTKAQQFSTQLDVIQPKNVLDYDYETTWYLTDGTKKSSGRKTTNSAVLFVDSM